ncbi:FkbM family methyltransferase [Endozoicomonas sp. SM1973]|uniref:FkbM family methyltransferase n=1 Tax=Spartinivicinus marinus TaxID=2994442 RepID=A0A853I7M7_9GAMM|nr:FkbM family methyltransferase [Spartinivicinus marinus]MCX4028850.1 FkbM family methyltransferase [Spartinivicinus marinus]NYZ65567.1 FkbM family methyltransferase [Spartinivicinus marinus]
MTSNIETSNTKYGEFYIIENDSIISQSIKMYGEWAENEICILKRFIKKNSIVFDVGAFIGTHSRAFSHLAANGKVFSFEPRQELFNILSKNIEVAPLSNIEAFNIGVGNKNSIISVPKLSLVENENFGGLPLLNCIDTTNVQEVEVYALDKLNFKNVDFIKIDVEGMEIDVLFGAEKLIENNEPVIFLEVNSLNNSRQVLEWASQREYDIYGVIADAYNKLNFKNNQENIFLNASEAGLLLLKNNITDEYCVKDLVKISCLDDVALLLMHKPQYPYEVLANTSSAEMLGLNYTSPLSDKLLDSIRRMDAEIVEKNTLILNYISESDKIKDQLKKKNLDLLELEQRRALLVKILDNEYKVSEKEKYIDLHSIAKMKYIKLLNSIFSVLKTGKRIMNNVTIVIPVYRGMHETKDCIHSTLKSIPSWATLLVINDCSPDEELSYWLRSYSKKKNFQLIENDKNLGFVATVNIGMALNLHSDILLLNSDVEVPESNWLERIRQAAYSDEKIGSVTPFSNNATICSFPNFCEDNELLGNLNVTEIDNIFSDLELETNIVEVPTGVGFCMYLRRDCLNDVGYFDEETFGKGYGEENDWCQRALKAGWKNTHQLNVFAFHKGGVSFADEGDPRKDKALELLQSLHPDYVRDVHNFISHDPAKKARELAFLSLLRKSKKKKVLLVSHRLGGGVSQHINELVEFYANEVDFLKLVPTEIENTVTVTYFLNGKEVNFKHTFNVKEEFTILEELLLYVGVDRVHYHHTMELPDELFGLATKLNLEYDYTVHDYFSINGNPTLTNNDGIFVGEDKNKTDVMCASRYPISCTIDEWRMKYGIFVNNASRIICPSKDTAKRFCEVYSSCFAKIIVSYHHDVCVKKTFAGKIRKFTITPKKKILILGALSKEKGADILEKVAASTSHEFHLLGYAYKPLEGVITHGPYDIVEADDLIEQINPDCIWFPAVWPETYSYTLSIALRTNLPIICPNLGAFPERVSERENSILLPWDITINSLVDFWSSDLSNSKIGQHQIKSNEYNTDLYLNKDFYKDNYLEFVKCPTKSNESSLYDLLGFSSSQMSDQLNRKEKALILLWKLRNSPFLSRFVNLIPFSFQRFVKKSLSSRPFHDLINIESK